MSLVLQSENPYSAFSLSLANGVSINYLIINGFRNVYNYTHSHYTTSAEIDAVRAQCNTYTTLCVGGTDSTTFMLVSCGNCLVVTNPTTLNSPVLNNNAYWYRTYGYSFGFSPTSSIIQDLADYTDEPSNLKLSWHIDNSRGGWRIGTILLLESTSYYKMMFIN